MEASESSGYDGGDLDSGVDQDGSDETELSDLFSDTDTEEKPDSDAVNRLASRMEEFMQTVAPEEEEEVDLSDWEDLFEEADEDEYEGGEYDPGEEEGEDELASEADQIVEELVEQKVQERLAPHLQAQYEERRHEQVLDLEQKYPELQEEEHAAPLLATAARLAKALGEPGLAIEAPFLETVHLRMRAEAAQTEENSGEGGSSEAPVEGAGGSIGSGSGEDAEAQARNLVVEASKRKGIFG